MNIEWHGQSAFTLRGSERSVLIDPFDQRLRPEGMTIRFDYPQIPQQRVDLLLITHEHFDHNGAAVADGGPHVVRSTAGSFDGTPVGEVIAIASEHDDQAGTRRGRTRSSCSRWTASASATWATSARPRCGRSR